MSRRTSADLGDAELIRRAQRGDREAFGLLYERYVRKIYRYLMARLSDRELAEDMCETVFLKAFESLNRYQDRGYPFSAYLYRIGRNMLTDHYRQQGEGQSFDAIVAGMAHEDGPEAIAEQRERHAALTDALNALPSDYQEVIRLRVQAGLTTAETAAWMARSEGAVRVLLHRALRALRKSVTGGADERV